MLKICWFYARRDFIKKPQQFRALIIVTMLVMMSVTFFLTYLECENRIQISIYSPENYHIRIEHLTPAQAEEAASRKEVECSYINYLIKYNSELEEEAILELKLRFYPEYAAKSGAIAREILNTYGLIELPQYAKYQSSMKIKLLDDIYNYDFYYETTTPYLARLSTVIVVFLFSLFLGSSVILLFHEKYERSVREYGTLRAIGMKRRDIVIINLMETMLVVGISAILVIIFSAGAFTCLAHIFPVIDNDVVYEYVTHFPFGNILLVFVSIAIGALGGCAVTCGLSYHRSDIELINGQIQNNISFVKQSNPKFDRASSPGIYTRIHLCRMKKRQLLNAITIAITLPLPLYYTVITIKIMNDNAPFSLYALFVYFITIIIILASAILTIVTASYHIMWRKREFSTFRLIGTSKYTIFGLVIPENLISSFICSLPGGIVSFFTYEKVAFIEAPIVKSNTLIEGYEHYNWSMVHFIILFGAMAALIIVILPNLIGTSVTLFRSLKASIIEGIREVE